MFIVEVGRTKTKAFVAHLKRVLERFRERGQENH